MSVISVPGSRMDTQPLREVERPSYSKGRRARKRRVVGEEKNSSSNSSKRVCAEADPRAALSDQTLFNIERYAVNGVLPTKDFVDACNEAGVARSTLSGVLDPEEEEDEEDEAYSDDVAPNSSVSQCGDEDEGTISIARNPSEKSIQSRSMYAPLVNVSTEKGMPIMPCRQHGMFCFLCEYETNDSMSHKDNIVIVNVKRAIRNAVDNDRRPEQIVREAQNAYNTLARSMSSYVNPITGLKVEKPEWTPKSIVAHLTISSTEFQLDALRIKFVMSAMIEDISQCIKDRNTNMVDPNMARLFFEAVRNRSAFYKSVEDVAYSKNKNKLLELQLNAASTGTSKAFMFE